MTVIRKCRQCTKTKPVSPASGLCAECAISNIAESVYQQQQKEGPIYEKWKRGLRASLERGEVSENA